MSEINLTIGVAIYNIQKFLPSCLNTLILQEGNDIEILLVDDGSTDNSGNICDEFAKKDERIKVIHQANAGRGLVRNTIIDKANGKWITFVDGDDALEPDACKIFRKYFQSTFNVIVFAEKNNCKNSDLTEFSPLTITDMEYYLAGTYANIYPYVLKTVWGKLFKTSFLRSNNLTFKNLKKAQDYIFTIEYVKHLDSIKLVPEIVYKYNTITSGITIGYNPKLIIYIDEFMKCMYSTLLTNDSIKDSSLLKLLYREGWIEITNILSQCIYNPRCFWGRRKRLSNIKQILEKEWVQNCLKHPEDILPKADLKTFLDCGLNNDINAIDCYYYAKKQQRIFRWGKRILNTAFTKLIKR